MGKPNDGGPAFPSDDEQWDDAVRRPVCRRHTGMSLRAYLAGRAMQGMLANPNRSPEGAYYFASHAIRFADALIAELAKEVTDGN